jgi:hypothetical protein
MQMELGITLYVGRAVVDMTAEADVDAEGTLLADHLDPVLAAVEAHNDMLARGVPNVLTLNGADTVIYDKVSAVTWEVWGRRYEGHDD